jgi:hypothetical protein
MVCLTRADSVLNLSVPKTWLSRQASGWRHTQAPPVRGTHLLLRGCAPLPGDTLDADAVLLIKFCWPNRQSLNGMSVTLQ